MPNYNTSNSFIQKLLMGSLPPLPPDPTEESEPFVMADKPRHKGTEVPVTDYREGIDPRKSFTGKYPEGIIGEIIQHSKKIGLDPNLALAVGMQESNLGSAKSKGFVNSSNPLMLNQDHSFKWPSNELLGGLEDDSVSTDARDALDREASIPAALKYLRTQLEKYPDNLEHGIQAYNGLGKPEARVTYKRQTKLPDGSWRVDEQKEGGYYNSLKSSELPQDFYGKRILDLKQNVIEKSPLFQQLVERYLNQK